MKLMSNSRSSSRTFATDSSSGSPDSDGQSPDVQPHKNHPDLWLDQFPWPHPSQHKYMRGHVLIRGGGIMTGAARLAAMASARTGAGLVSVAAPSASWPVYAAALTSVMVLPCDGLQAWQSLLSDSRRNVIVIGPGAGRTDTLCAEVLSALELSRAVVLDADALTAFSGQGATLFQAITGPCVLTPHSGEFTRLFGPGVGGASKLERTRAAARISSAVVVLKGADTIIAAPDGRVIVNNNAPPELATGGTGDVLAGIIAGLAAQGMDVFNAAAAAVWMHGRAATLFGPGLIAEDLPQMLIPVLRELKGLPVKRADL